MEKMIKAISKLLHHKDLPEYWLWHIFTWDDVKKEVLRKIK